MYASNLQLANKVRNKTEEKLRDSELQFKNLKFQFNEREKMFTDL